MLAGEPENKIYDVFNENFCNYSLPQLGNDDYGHTKLGE